MTVLIFLRTIFTPTEKTYSSGKKLVTWNAVDREEDFFEICLRFFWICSNCYSKQLAFHWINGTSQARVAPQDNGVPKRRKKPPLFYLKRLQETFRDSKANPFISSELESSSLQLIPVESAHVCMGTPSYTAFILH